MTSNSLRQPTQSCVLQAPFPPTARKLKKSKVLPSDGGQNYFQPSTTTQPIQQTFQPQEIKGRGLHTTYKGALPDVNVYTENRRKQTTMIEPKIVMHIQLGKIATQNSHLAKKKYFSSMKQIRKELARENQVIRDQRDDSQSKSRFDQQKNIERLQNMLQSSDRKLSLSSNDTKSSEIPQRRKKKVRQTQNKVYSTPFADKEQRNHLQGSTKPLLFRMVRSDECLRRTQIKKSMSGYYQTHTQRAYPYGRKSTRFMNYRRFKGFKILTFNVDCFIQSKYDNRYPCKREYHRTSLQERIQKILMMIIFAMEENVDFILVQEAHNKEMRTELLKALEKWNDNQQNTTYFFPENLKLQIQCHKTLILTRHEGVFGQLQFTFPEHLDQQKGKYYYPSQAFFEFQIKINNKKERVCILTCHLRCDKDTIDSQFTPENIREIQILCIDNFRLEYDRFFCIGDTNIPSIGNDDQNDFVLTKFSDPEHSSSNGSYMYRLGNGRIQLQRLDRVWMNHEIQEKTIININYWNEKLLGCQQLNPREMLLKDKTKYVHVTPSDHTPLAICIRFTS